VWGEREGGVMVGARVTETGCGKEEEALRNPDGSGHRGRGTEEEWMTGEGRRGKEDGCGGAVGWRGVTG